MLLALVQNVQLEWTTITTVMGNLQSVGLIEGPYKKLFCLSLLQMYQHSYFSSAKIYLSVGYPWTQSITADSFVSFLTFLFEKKIYIYIYRKKNKNDEKEEVRLVKDVEEIVEGELKNRQCTKRQCILIHKQICRENKYN